MTKEEKELLLKDLCARLPYGIMVDIKYSKENGSSDRLRICSEGSLTLNTDLLGLYIEDEIHLKPYLRPMSSMTQDERMKMLDYTTSVYRDYHQEESDTVIYQYKLDEYLNWLNQHHFDYRGLISKGLALEAPSDMYK